MDIFRVGLTGGVGSGKTTIASLLAASGAGVVDADEIAHRLTQPQGAAIAPIRSAFGPQALTAQGALDRSWMRLHAFADTRLRRQLEGILHPLIRAEMERQARELAQEGRPYVVFVIPLLVESGQARDRVERVLLVDCSVETQLQRVCQRPGIDEALARQIISAQASRAERLACADDVIFNEAPMPIIEAGVERLHRYYLVRAQLRATAAGTAAG